MTILWSGGRACSRPTTRPDEDQGARRARLHSQAAGEREQGWTGGDTSTYIQRKLQRRPGLDGSGCARGLHPHRGPPRFGNSGDWKMSPASINGPTNAPSGSRGTTGACMVDLRVHQGHPASVEGKNRAFVWATASHRVQQFCRASRSQLDPIADASVPLL